ncbi:MAG: hypothetical protein D3909_04325 [Candidatus Electrothrix sp. ATG1]|nr:hypothetical protein [Candidatus Electrothrix sp. ATG1]
MPSAAIGAVQQTCLLIRLIESTSCQHQSGRGCQNSPNVLQCHDTSPIFFVQRTSRNSFTALFSLQYPDDNFDVRDFFSAGIKKICLEQAELFHF